MSRGLSRPSKWDCPVCFLPLPIDERDSQIFNCCSKVVCYGCMCESTLRGGSSDCPFCRTPLPSDDQERIRRLRSRVGARDPVAMWQLGMKLFDGSGLRRDRARALELWRGAAELGSSRAHYSLGYAYLCGLGVAADDERARHHYELAAAEGNVHARHSLGDMEYKDGNADAALGHWMISAKMGDKESLDVIRRMHAHNLATKDQYAEALFGYRDASDEMKSPARDAAKLLNFSGVVHR